LSSSAAPNESKSVVNAKSIAVLPFENLSRDPDNAFSLTGVQDEILTDLAKIADLKVISPRERDAVQNRHRPQSAQDR
jgi:TolB-like protein